MIKRMLTRAIGNTISVALFGSPSLKYAAAGRKAVKGLWESMAAYELARKRAEGDWLTVVAGEAYNVDRKHTNGCSPNGGCIPGCETDDELRSRYESTS